LLEFEVFYREVAAMSWFEKLLGFKPLLEPVCRARKLKDRDERQNLTNYKNISTVYYKRERRGQGLNSVAGV
jgi:hypothetical protein